MHSLNRPGSRKRVRIPFLTTRPTPPRHAGPHSSPSFSQLNLPVMPRATKARVLKPHFLNPPVTPAGSWVSRFSLGQRFHWSFASLRFARVAFSLLHNPRNTSKTTDPLVMAGANRLRCVFSLTAPDSPDSQSLVTLWLWKSLGTHNPFSETRSFESLDQRGSLRLPSN
jgi:hypothetical protein